ncbi:hypothetical protein JZK55_00620 [Dissulfurispira thermophila]|uniref:GAF domain-containing protein n=1 Tax=Dissulfurispira thermophila TaxID=2715679 RepID=A0A7G1GXT0_9BACT|nr:GAF domain-containing protein [Dissulfurispira thermophila]BCB95140.1 hypothetical protein JZK55_00620 [Dissulfurispira thermophila]
MITDSPDGIKQLNTLIELSALINSSLDIAEIRKRSIQAVTELVNAEAGSLLFLDGDTGELYFDVAIGEKGEHIKTIRLKRGEGIAGWVVEHNEPVIINDVQNDSRFFKGGDEKSDFTTKNMICVPVKTKDRLVSMPQAINKNDSSFSTSALDLLVGLFNQVAIAIENARLYNAFFKAYKEMEIVI